MKGNTMAPKIEQNAPKSESQDFQDAFAEDEAPAQEQSEDEAFGLALPKDGDGGAAPVAVIDIEPAAGKDTPAGEASGDAAAQASADDANAQANAGASAGERGSSPAVAETGGAAGGPAEGSPAEEAAETPAQEAAEEGAEAAGGAMDLDDASDVPPEDMQKFKSWQGRLKKLEQQLKDQAAKLGQPAQQVQGDAVEAAGDVADASGNTELAEAAEDLGEQVENGEITPEEAMAQLASDFGQPFINAIQSVVRMFAGQEMGSVKQDTADIIDHLTNQAKQSHFQTIHGAHPDFAQIHDDPRFKAWVAENGKQDVVDNGSAADINKMLSDYKAATGAASGGDTATQDGGPVSDEGAAGDDPPTAQADAAAAGEPAQGQGEIDEGALNDAEGVRSGGHGMRLPEQPKKGGDFVSAWNEF